MTALGWIVLAVGLALVISLTVAIIEARRWWASRREPITFTIAGDGHRVLAKGTVIRWRDGQQGYEYAVVDEVDGSTVTAWRKR